MPELQDQQQTAAVADLLSGSDLVADESASANLSGDQVAPKVDDVTALLADAPVADKPAAAPGAKPKGPATLAELAESSGIEVAELYKLAVPMRDGVEPLTIGALKDAAGKSQDLETLSTEIDERRTTFENEMIRARGELNAVVALLPQIPDALLAQAREKHLEHLQTERQALLDIKPEWADDKVYSAAQDDILEAVADYGFRRTDLDLVIDHRLTKLLHDFAGMKKRITAANARAKEIRDHGKRGGQRVSEVKRTETGRAAAADKAKHGTTGDKVRAVSALLQG